MGNQTSRELFISTYQQLLTSNVESTDPEVWDDLWKSNLSIDDVFELISPQSVRRLIHDYPENLRVLFTQAVAQFYQVVETPYPVYFDQALTCVRILTRLLPFIVESDAQFVHTLLWERQTVKKDPSAESEGEDQETEPLGVILVNTMFHLLFLPDFTIEDPNADFTENDVNSLQFKSALMWAPGVGSIEKSIVGSSQYDRNRIEVLRLMISAFCDSLFQSPDSYDSCQSLWLEVATSSDTPYADVVFYSLMNIVLGYDPIGWGLPYGNLLTTDTAKELSEVAVQTLLILIDYGYPISSSAATLSTVNNVPYVMPQDVDSQGFNVFRKIMHDIESPDHLNFIYRGFVRLLNNAHESESAYLPGSVTRISLEQELLVLLWKCLEEIPKFLPYIMKNCDVCELVVPICYFMIESRKDISKVGLCYLCTFLLLKMSGERNFGVGLNKPYNLYLPIDIPAFTGNHADLVIICLHKMIVSGLEKLSPLYNCFLTIICNISPYTKSLCSIAAVKLVNLFQLFTSPKFLYASEGNHIYVSMILETLNNIIQYQYEGNYALIYSIVRRKELFDSLANLTLPIALEVAGNVPKAEGVRKEDRHSSNSNHKSTEKSFKDNHKAAKKNGKTQGQEDHEEPVSHSVPTSLVSTQSVKRSISASGEVMDQTLSTAVPSNSDITHEVEAEEKSIIEQPKEEMARVMDHEPVADTHTVEESESMEADGEQSQLPPTSPKDTSSSSSSSSHRFIPTAQWLQLVKSELPMNTIMRLLKHLVPQLEDLAAKNNGNIDETLVIDFIKKTTMVGLLPVPHPIVIRKYQPNRFTSLWFSAFLWGVIFMHNQTYPMFDNTQIKLFIVQSN